MGVQAVEIHTIKSEPDQNDPGKVVRVSPGTFTAPSEIERLRNLKTDGPSTDTLGTRTRTRTVSGGGSKTKVKKDNVSGTQQCPDERQNFLSVAQKTLFTVYGGNPFPVWQKDKKNDKVASSGIGFDCNNGKLVATAFGKDIYPACGMVIGKNLLTKEEDSLIWIEAFYNEWDKSKSAWEQKLKSRADSKGFELIFYDRLDAAVQKMAKKTMTLIMNIKFVTPTKLLESQDTSYSAMKIMRVRLMMGWVDDLKKEVDLAVKNFFVYLDSVATVARSMTFSKRSAVKQVLGSLIKPEDLGSDSEDGPDSPFERNSDDGDEANSDDGEDAEDVDSAQSD